jgi:homoserine kinase
MPEVRVRVPASSANLGPGYDSFGLGLAMYDEFGAEPADAWSVEVAGEGVAELSHGADNQVARAIARVFDACGHAGAARVSCANGIPTGRGLGSSSAAIVGGLMLGNALAGAGLPREGLFRMAVELEGHPDNVAAALFGSLTISWTDAEGPNCAILAPGGGLAAVAVPRDTPLATTSARAMLPSEVPHADAAFNAGRAGLLVAALLLGSGELLGPGLEDRLHQPYREAVIGDLGVVREALIAAGADGAALSGAGPTVIGLVLAEDDESAIARATVVARETTRRLAGVAGRGAAVALGIDRTGAVPL